MKKKKNNIKKELNNIPDRYYIAYGSNMDLSRLKSRCPNSELVGTGVIEGYKLIFRKSASGFYASIDRVDYRKKKKRKSLWLVPVVIFKISEQDEDNLDKYEGYPKWYKKVKLSVKDIQGSIINGLAYVLPETARTGVPDLRYYSIISGAYEKFGIDRKYLEKALVISYKQSSTGVEEKKCINKGSTSYLPVNIDWNCNINNGQCYESDLFTFLKEFERELESKEVSNFVDIRLEGSELNIIDIESGDVWFVIYPSNRGEEFYMENIIENDYTDYLSIRDAVKDIESCIFDKLFY